MSSKPVPISTETTPPRRRVSRETRQLLTAALIALVALWVLARIRFLDRPAAPSSFPSLLSQLSPTPRFANLASEIDDLQNRLAGSWLAIPAPARPDEAGVAPPRALTGLRFRPDAAIVLLEGDDGLAHDADVLGADRASGLAVIRVNPDPSDPGVNAWTPPSLDGPRYFMATSVTPDRVVLRPVLVGSLEPVRSPAWSGPVWAVPPGTDLEAGSFLFTTSGELAGLVVVERAGPLIVPGTIAVAEAERLQERGVTPRTDLRLEVQPLTGALAKATGASSGVVVAWVDPQGPATGQLVAGDVIEALNDEPVADMRDWDVRTRRLSPGVVTVRVRRKGDPLDVRVTLSVLDEPTPSPSLGLRLTALPGVGSAVVGVDRGSVADAARLREGDMITRAGDVSAPAPADVTAVFEAAATDDAILLTITREGAHRVLALIRR